MPAGYRFEWDAVKAAGNLKKHGISLDEAITVFGDSLTCSCPIPATVSGKGGIFSSARPIGSGCWW